MVSGQLEPNRLHIHKRGRLMIAQCRPLIEMLAEIAGFRQSRGRRHGLPVELALICVDMLWLCCQSEGRATDPVCRQVPRTRLETGRSAVLGSRDT